MQKLSDLQNKAFVAALRGEPFDRKTLELALRKLRTALAANPNYGGYDTIHPYLKDWRRDQQWALDLASRHQSACEAAEREYLRVMWPAEYSETKT